MEEYAAIKYVESEYLPAGVIAEAPGPYGKYRPGQRKMDLRSADGGESGDTPEKPEDTQPAGEEMGRLVVPSAIWTAGVLYYTYFVGEEMRLFDVADILVTRWSQGKLDATDERTIIALDRLMKKRERRMAQEEREMLYKRVFNFGRSGSGGYILFNETFPLDWNRLMKGVAAYPVKPMGEDDPAASAARTMIFQATYDLQLHLSEAMAGTAYMMAAEVFTLLREASDLLRSEEIIQSFGVQGLGMNSVIEHIAAEEFNRMIPVDLLSTLGESGSRILQDWVAKFNAQTWAETPGDSLHQSLIHTLVTPAQAWRAANSQLSGM